MTIKDLMDEMRAVGNLEAHLAKSNNGLSPEQTLEFQRAVDEILNTRLDTKKYDEMRMQLRKHYKKVGKPHWAD